MLSNVLFLLYSLLVTSNRKAVCSTLTTNNLLVDLSYSSTHGFTRPSLEDNSCIWRCPSGEITTTLLEPSPTTYTSNRHANNVRIHGDSCQAFVAYYIYYIYTSITSKSRWCSNTIAIFDINCIISIGSYFISIYLE